MTGRISTRHEADDDLIRSYARIAEHDFDVADGFLDQVRSSFERLASLPQLGSVRAFRADQLKGIRTWPVSGFPRYLIFYFPTADGIDVVRVLHSSQDINAILDEDYGDSDR